tara:strand:+ start:186 stop:416 length:231 start_codon:yes stop_codon:yes gene_type:complete
MVELTLLALLNSVGDNFCKYRAEGNDSYKALLLAYSDVSAEYGVEEVKSVIEKSSNLSIAAVAIAVTKCPQLLNSK